MNYLFKSAIDTKMGYLVKKAAPFDILYTKFLSTNKCLYHELYKMNHNQFEHNLWSRKDPIVCSTHERNGTHLLRDRQCNLEIKV